MRQEVQNGTLKLLNYKRGGEKILKEDVTTGGIKIVDYILLFIEPTKRPEL